jgi:hypothetical protein
MVCRGLERIPALGVSCVAMHLRIDVSHAVRLLGAALLLGSAACGGGAASAPRTAAASQPTPAAFDPAQSDAQALTVVDATIAAAGGAAAWEQVKQIQWESKYHQNEAFAGWFKHSWDRWNGRHRFETTDLAEYKKAEEAGKLGDVKWLIVAYDLFDRPGTAWATYGGFKGTDAAEVDRLASDAYQRWQADSYLLALPHKLRDPGVILNYVGEAQEANGKCQGGCIVVKVSFAPEVGTDVYLLNINKGTNMPDVIEKQTSAGTLAYAVEGWSEAGGLKFPSRLRNLGAAEAITFENIRIGQPDDSLYRAPVQR